MPRKRSENWKFFPCQIGQDVAFIYLNVEAGKYLDQAPGMLAKVRVTYKAPRANGLPTGEEFDAVRSIEHDLDRFARRGKDDYVGRITRAGHRVFYIYTRRGKTEWRKMLEKLSSQSGYTLALVHKSDRRHNGYWKELYPTDDDWQVITDIDVVEALQSAGDIAGIRRNIDHWVYFKNAVDAAKFVRWAVKGPYKHDKKWSTVGDDGEHCVRVHHLGPTRQQDISHHTIGLNRKARELGGRYDGWETQVVKRKTPATGPRPGQRRGA